MADSLSASTKSTTITMVNHLNKFAVLFTAFLFAALALSATSGLTADISQVPKQFEINDGGHLVLYRGKQVVWEMNIEDSSSISMMVSTDVEGNKKVSTSDLKPEDYHGKMVQLDGNISRKRQIWLVGADGKRRLIPNRETYNCLKGIGLEDPTSVSSNTLDQIPNLENVPASCGIDRIGPDGALEKGSYLLTGDYKFILTNRDLVLTQKGNQVWSTGTGGAGPAVQLILQKDGNLVAYNSEYKPVWSSKTNGRKPGWLKLGDDGSLNLYDDKGRIIWFP